MQTNILEYLPAIFAEIKEMKAHAAAEKPELERLWKGYDSAYNNQFLHSMTEYGVNRWEKMLSIIPAADESIEDRRFRVISRLNMQLPYSFRKLEMYLNQMCGVKKYTIVKDFDNFTINIYMSLEKEQLAEVEHFLKRIMPCNMIVNINNIIPISITGEVYSYAQIVYTEKIEVTSEESMEGY